MLEELYNDAKGLKVSYPSIEIFENCISQYMMAVLSVPEGCVIRGLWYDKTTMFLGCNFHGNYTFYQFHNTHWVRINTVEQCYAYQHLSQSWWQKVGGYVMTPEDQV